MQDVEKKTRSHFVDIVQKFAAYLRKIVNTLMQKVMRLPKEGGRRRGGLQDARVNALPKHLLLHPGRRCPTCFNTLAQLHRS